MVEKGNKKYKAKRGAFFSDEKAQIYGECIDSLKEKKGGAVRPIDVLAEAEDKYSPLHDYFEWDNELASTKYRLWQARHLMGRIVTVKITEGGKEIEQRAFLNVSVVTEGGVEPVYVTLEKALTDNELRAQTLAKAMKEIEYWIKKYKDFRELIPIFEAKKRVSEVIERATHHREKTV